MKSIFFPVVMLVGIAASTVHPAHAASVQHCVGTVEGSTITSDCEWITPPATQADRDEAFMRIDGDGRMSWLREHKAPAKCMNNPADLCRELGEHYP
jgi:hypothetical protein